MQSCAPAGARCRLGNAIISRPAFRGTAERLVARRSRPWPGCPDEDDATCADEMQCSPTGSLRSRGRLCLRDETGHLEAVRIPGVAGLPERVPSASWLRSSDRPDYSSKAIGGQGSPTGSGSVPSSTRRVRRYRVEPVRSQPSPSRNAWTIFRVGRGHGFSSSAAKVSSAVLYPSRAPS